MKFTNFYLQLCRFTCWGLVLDTILLVMEQYCNPETKKVHAIICSQGHVTNQLID